MIVAALAIYVVVVLKKKVLGKREMGSALMGSLQISCF